MDAVPFWNTKQKKKIKLKDCWLNKSSFTNRKSENETFQRCNSATYGHRKAFYAAGKGAREIAYAVRKKVSKGFKNRVLRHLNRSLANTQRAHGSFREGSVFSTWSGIFNTPEYEQDTGSRKLIWTGRSLGPRVQPLRSADRETETQGICPSSHQ